MFAFETKPGLSGVHMTAIGVAALRAAHLIEAAEPKIFRDPYALTLADITEADALAAAHSPDLIDTPGITGTFVVRSRFTEDRLAAARDRVRQYVILGAGLDSFALRMAGRLKGLAVFEVDDPPMQAWKRKRLKALGLALPPELHFVPCDFERTSLVEALAAAGFDAAEPTFVSWLGVTMYLSKEAVAQTLRWAASLPPGSEIVLTYGVPGEEANQVKALMSEHGVTFGTFYTPEEMTEMLKDAGFRQIEHLTPARADEIYFAGRTDELRAPTLERIVSATVV